MPLPKLYTRLCPLIAMALLVACGSVTPDDPADAATADAAETPDGGAPDGDVPDGGSTCGDGVRDEGEACDTDELGAQTCQTQGFPGGAIACRADCTLDTSACTVPPDCGNQTIDGDEQCDGPTLGGATCASLGYLTGELRCGGGCRYDLSTCSNCGDNDVDTGEVCDGTDLDGKTCVDVGSFSGGALACNAACTGFATAGCFGPPTVPQLRLPMNNDYIGFPRSTGTMRPTFAWAASTVQGGAGVRYELQYDTSASFTAAPVTLMTALTSHQVAADLPISTVPPVGTRYYWRVRACAGSACSSYSRARWINVGRSARDFNGDGYSDIWIAAPMFDPPAKENAGRIYLYLGGPSVNVNTPSKTFDGEAAGDALGGVYAYRSHGLSYLGDVNGDGFSDVAFGAPGFDANGSGSGRVYVHYGANPPNYVTDLTLDGPIAGDNWGTEINAAGDVDGDGFDDVVLGITPSVNGAETSETLVLRGAASGLGATIADRLPLSSATGVGDVNGDGYADVGGGPASVGNNGAIYTGGPALFGETPFWTAYATYPAPIGDVNVDGRADWGGRVIACGFLDCSYSTTVSLGAALLADVATTTAVPASTTITSGSAICPLGDWSGGGAPDWLISVSGSMGPAWVFRGEAPFDTTTSDLTVATGGSLNSCAGNKDVNGDGKVDFLTSDQADAGHVYFFSGNPANATADLTFTGAAMNDVFGMVVE
jgi:hypothetical protein